MPLNGVLYILNIALLSLWVQVKSNKLNQLWSVAKLCKRDQKNPGTSILEKLFANERGAESCRFRIVTCCDVNEEVSGLISYRDSLAKVFSGYFSPKCSRSVLPVYSVLNIPLRWSSGTTNFTNSSNAPGK